MTTYIDNVKVLFELENGGKELTNADEMEISRLISEGYTEGEIQSYCPELKDSVSGWWEIVIKTDVG